MEGKIRDRELDSLIKHLAEKYTPEGADRQVVVRGDSLVPVRFIPAPSPALGFVLGTGGWPEGRLIEFFGKEGSGKSTLMLLSLKGCWEYYEGERPIALIDVEHRYNPEWAKLLGLPVDEIIVSQPPTAESASDIARDLIQKGRVCAIGFDSVGHVATSREHRPFDQQQAVMAGAASVMSRFVKQVSPLANLFTTTVFLCNQLRDDMEGFHRPMTPGGHALKHAMSIRVYLRPGAEKIEDTSRPSYDGKSKIEVGFPMHFKTVKNSFAPYPRSGYSDFFFDAPNMWHHTIGFNAEADIQKLGVIMGVFVRKGGWYEYNGVKGQGRDGFFKALSEARLKDQVFQEVIRRLSQRLGTSTMYDERSSRPVGEELEDPDV